MDHTSVSSPPRFVVELVCPPEGMSQLATDIRARGNIPLSIDGTAVLELAMCDVSETWAAANRMPAQRAAALSWQLASRLSEDDAPETHSEEAAALFLLALRHHHASFERAMAGCRIRWNASATSEKVEYLI
jgi:hypothetical protein